MASPLIRYWRVLNEWKYGEKFFRTIGMIYNCTKKSCSSKIRDFKIYIFKGKESEKKILNGFFFHKTSILWVFRLKFLVFLFSRMMKNLKSNDFYKTLPKFFSDFKFLEHSLKKSMLKILANCHIKPLFSPVIFWKSWDFKSFSFKV